MTTKQSPPMPANPSPDAWQLLARVVRERREFIGLSQEDLAIYGGPKKTTVSKIERAAETSYSPRTQQQLEKALGWDRGAVRDILSIAEEHTADDASVWVNDYIAGELPDLTSSNAEVDLARRAADLTDDELLAELAYRMKRYARELEADAVDLMAGVDFQHPTDSTGAPVIDMDARRSETSPRRPNLEHLKDLPATGEPKDRRDQGEGDEDSP